MTVAHSDAMRATHTHERLLLRQLMCASVLVCLGGTSSSLASAGRLAPRAARPSAFQSRDTVTPPTGLAALEGTVVTDDTTARPVGRAIVTLTGVVPYFSRMTS